MECPFVDRSFIPTPEFNRPVTFDCDNGNKYIFYDHDDGFGKHSNVQFCKLIGRKRDVFECLNENEWKNCGHYRSKQKQERRPVSVWRKQTCGVCHTQTQSRGRFDHLP